MMLWKDRKRRGSGGDASKDDGDAWAMTYGDMMSLLLVFFILIVAISTVDPVKMQQVSQQMRESLGGKQEVVQTLKEIEEELQASIEDLQLDDIVQVNRNKDGVSLVMRGESFFPSGSAILYPTTHTFLNEIAWQIQKNPYLVSVEGHSDNIPISTSQYPSNWELSGARAASVVRYLELRGIRRSRMRIIGWADAKPVDPSVGNSTPEARAQNRRVVITFLNEFAERSVDSEFIPSRK